MARAEIHRQSLTHLWNDPDVNDAYRSRAKVNRDGTGEFFIEPVNRDWLLPFSIQFGEMLYQLRGALDSCVYDAAVLKFGTDPPPDEQKWNFPVVDSVDKFNDSVKRMPKLPDDVRSLIEGVQPYKSPVVICEGSSWKMGDALLILNNWARIDRHRKLHLCGTLPISGGLQLSSGLTFEFCQFTGGKILEDESKVASFKIANYAPGTKVNVQANFAFDVFVNEVPHCRLQDISVAMSLSVQGAREAFERHFGIKR